MPPGGYFGKALLVDLSTGSGTAAAIEEPALRSYIGGAGLGALPADHTRQVRRGGLLATEPTLVQPLFERRRSRLAIWRAGGGRRDPEDRAAEDWSEIPRPLRRHV